MLVLKSNHGNAFYYGHKSLFLDTQFLQRVFYPSEKKEAVVRDWPTPSTIKEVQAFAGFANYYRHSKKDFTKRAAQLTSLSKTSPLHFTGAQNNSMHSLNYIQHVLVLLFYRIVTGTALSFSTQMLPILALVQFFHKRMNTEINASLHLQAKPFLDKGANLAPISVQRIPAAAVVHGAPIS